jgi:hypothetical protein
MAYPSVCTQYMYAPGSNPTELFSRVPKNGLTVNSRNMLKAGLESIFYQKKFVENQYIAASNDDLRVRMTTLSTVIQGDASGLPDSHPGIPTGKTVRSKAELLRVAVEHIVRRNEHGTLQ